MDSSAGTFSTSLSAVSAETLPGGVSVVGGGGAAVAFAASAASAAFPSSLYDDMGDGVSEFGQSFRRLASSSFVDDSTAIMVRYDFLRLVSSLHFFLVF